MDGKVRHLQQSIFAPLGLVLRICVGESVRFGEGYPRHSGLFPCLSHFPASPCARIKAHFPPPRSYPPILPQHETLHTILNQLSSIWPHSLSADPASQAPIVLVHLGSQSEFTQPLQTGKRREWWVPDVVNQRYEFRIEILVLFIDLRIAQAIDFEGEVNLFHFYLLRSVGKGAFGKV